MTIFEITRECTLTKDVVCSMITISEDTITMATMEMDPWCNCKKQEYQDFHSLTLVICDTSTIGAKVEVLLEETFSS